MDVKKATKVTVHRPRLDGKGFTAEEWEVDKERLNPMGDLDKVERLLVVYSAIPHVEVHYQDFGEEWILSHISYIEFQDERYREIQDQKERDRKAKNTERIKQGFN